MKGKKELKKRITIRKIERRKKKRRKGVNIQTERERRNKIKKYKMTYYLKKNIIKYIRKKACFVAPLPHILCTAEDTPHRLSL